MFNEIYCLQSESEGEENFLLAPQRENGRSRRDYNHVMSIGNARNKNATSLSAYIWSKKETGKEDPNKAYSGNGEK